MEVIEIKNTFLQSSSYLYGKCLIDCGDAVVEYVSKHNYAVDSILLTHCHHDHVCGLQNLLNMYPLAKVYCSPRTHEGLNDAVLNLSFTRPEYPFVFEGNDRIIEITTGMFTVSGMNVEVINSIGHSDDCLSYIINDNLFTGDAHIPSKTVFTKWPTSNAEQAKHSEELLKRLKKQYNLIIRPGHWQ